jgi:hypothetical protein
VEQDLYYEEPVPKKQLRFSKYCVTCPKCGTKRIHLRA